MEGNPLPTAVEKSVIQEEKRKDEEDVQIPRYLPIGNQKSAPICGDNERL